MIQDNITFNSVKNEGLHAESYPLYRSTINGVNPDFGGIINAVDIDWNDAQLKKLDSKGTSTINTTITTTGQLLSIIKTLVEKCAIQSQQIEQLQSAIVTLSNAIVQNISSSESSISQNNISLSNEIIESLNI